MRPLTSIPAEQFGGGPNLPLSHHLETLLLAALVTVFVTTVILAIRTFRSGLRSRRAVRDTPKPPLSKRLPPAIALLVVAAIALSCSVGVLSSNPISSEPQRLAAEGKLIGAELSEKMGTPGLTWDHYAVLGRLAIAGKPTTVETDALGVVSAYIDGTASAEIGADGTKLLATFDGEDVTFTIENPK